MSRPRSVDETELLSRLAVVFRDVGYDGATLAMLAEATGLKKASLYHRFPGGKEQMAREVLAASTGRFAEKVLAPLEAAADPRAKVERLVAGLRDFYAGGRKACLLNMLASPRAGDGPFSDAIRRAFEALLEAFAAVAREAGHDDHEAGRRAARAVKLIHGGLVLSRGLADTGPFIDSLHDLSAELLPPNQGDRP